MTKRKRHAGLGGRPKAAPTHMFHGVFVGAACGRPPHRCGTAFLCGARRRPRKVRFTLFPPNGENSLRSLARPLTTRPTSLGSCCVKDGGYGFFASLRMTEGNAMPGRAATGRPYEKTLWSWGRGGLRPPAAPMRNGFFMWGATTRRAMAAPSDPVILRPKAEESVFPVLGSPRGPTEGETPFVGTPYLQSPLPFCSPPPSGCAGQLPRPGGAVMARRGRRAPRKKWSRGRLPIHAATPTAQAAEG